MTKAWGVLVALLALPFSIALGRELFAASRCVERGGLYDYFRALCYMSAEQAFDPRGASPLLWISGYLVLKIIAVAIIAVMPWKVPVPAWWRRRVGSLVGQKAAV